MNNLLLLCFLLAAGTIKADGGRNDLLADIPLNDKGHLHEFLSNKFVKADDEERMSINDQADILFAEIRKYVAEQEIDPIRLPSDSDAFTVTLYNQTMNGIFEISNVRIGGFSALHRTGECTLTTGLQGIDVVVDFGSNDILLGADVSFGAGILGANIQLQLVISHVSLMVKVRAKASEPQLSLQDFTLNEIGRINFDIKGIPMGSKSLSNLLNVVSNSVKDTLLYAFQEALRPLIESIITSPTAASFLRDRLSRL